MFMLARRSVPCLATIGVLLLGATGCGGGVPSTGESLKALPEDSAKHKTMAEGYKKKFQQPKDQAKVKGSGP
jgi:hypothetical protein